MSKCLKIGEEIVCQRAPLEAENAMLRAQATVMEEAIEAFRAGLRENAPKWTAYVLAKYDAIKDPR